MKYKIIAGMCQNRGIGKDGSLPWKIKEDMQFFSKLTKGNGNNAVIMGKNTWESACVELLCIILYYSVLLVPVYYSVLICTAVY